MIAETGSKKFGTDDKLPKLRLVCMFDSDTIFFRILGFSSEVFTY